MANLAFLLIEQTPGKDSVTMARNYLSALPLLSKAADGGVVPAMTALADLYREGRGVEPDTLKAESLYLNAVRAGSGDAEKKLMAMNLAGYASLSADKALAEGLRAARSGASTVAFTLYGIAAQGDIPRAYTLLADSYSSAKGTDYNHEEALANYVRGALGGDPSAQFILAELLEIFPDALSGKLPPDAGTEESTPAYWYAKAQESGVTSAREAARILFEETPLPE